MTELLIDKLREAASLIGDIGYFQLVEDEFDNRHVIRPGETLTLDEADVWIMAAEWIEAAQGLATHVNSVLVMLEQFGGMHWSDSSLGEALTCSEAEALASIVAITDGEDGREAVLLGHCGQDDMGDDHFLLRDDITDEARAEYLAEQEADDE